MCIIFRAFVDFVTVLLLFRGLVFGCEACGILTPQLGIDAHPLRLLESRVVTTDLQGSPQIFTFNSPCSVGFLHTFCYTYSYTFSLSHYYQWI